MIWLSLSELWLVRRSWDGDKSRSFVASRRAASRLETDVKRLIFQWSRLVAVLQTAVWRAPDRVRWRPERPEPARRRRCPCRGSSGAGRPDWRPAAWPVRSATPSTGRRSCSAAGKRRAGSSRRRWAWPRCRPGWSPQTGCRRRSSPSWHPAGWWTTWSWPSARRPPARSTCSGWLGGTPEGARMTVAQAGSNLFLSVFFWFLELSSYRAEGLKTKAAQSHNWTTVGHYSGKNLTLVVFCLPPEKR